MADYHVIAQRLLGPQATVEQVRAMKLKLLSYTDEEKAGTVFTALRTLVEDVEPAYAAQEIDETTLNRHYDRARDEIVRAGGVTGFLPKEGQVSASDLRRSLLESRNKRG